jgi:hypothetical protein
VQGEDLGCVLCEFAMQVVDEHLEDTTTIDEVAATRSTFLYL